MSDLSLVIGTRAWSSWSLRPWLGLKHTGCAFDEVLFPLRQPNQKARLLQHSPTGKVPVLKHGAVTIWDSLAILEYVAELFPDAGLWPEDRTARALARSVSAEMHSGFVALRTNMPMDLLNRFPEQGRTPETLEDIARITALWSEMRSRFGAGGAFLFGRFSIADCMFAPVVTRFVTYEVDLDPVCRAYVDAVLALPAMAEWTDKARAEA